MDYSSTRSYDRDSFALYSYKLHDEYSFTRYSHIVRVLAYQTEDWQPLCLHLTIYSELFAFCSSHHDLGCPL